MSAAELPEPRPARRVPERVRRYVLVALSGFLRVTACGYCAALVLAGGADQHEATHRAEGADRG